MRTTINIEQIIGIAFMAEFFVYGLMAFTLYPYEDYGVAQRMQRAESKQYLHARRLLGVAYVILGMAALLGLHPASTATGAGVWQFDTGWQFNLVPACLTLFFTAHARMLLGLCDWAPAHRLAHLLYLSPLPLLCAAYAVCPAWGEAVALLQSLHLVLLIGYYTPLFYRGYAYLDRSCRDAVNETPRAVAPDYDCLPESMPWVGRRYKVLLIITLLALLAHFLPFGWTAYVVVALFVGYIFWSFYWVFLRFPHYARALFYFMNEENEIINEEYE